MFGTKKVDVAPIKVRSQATTTIVLKFNPFSPEVHLNEEAPVSFTVASVPNGASAGDVAWDLVAGEATFPVQMDDAPGDLVIKARIFPCHDSGQCGSENLEFKVPVEFDASAPERQLVEYTYNLEVERKLKVFL